MIDLMYVIARRLGMFVKFYLPPDGKWGSKQGEPDAAYWTGMIGEVIKKEVSVFKMWGCCD